MNAKLTIYFVVGGAEYHYKNLARSIRSVRERMRLPFSISILEIGTKLSSENDIRVFSEPELISFAENKKVGFKFWQQKYRIAEFIDTEYGLYLDSDTVLVNDNFEELIAAIGDHFGASQHFWVPTFKRYVDQAVPWRNRLQYWRLKRKLGARNKYPFFSGGAFLFKNTAENRTLLRETATLYDRIYPESSSYVRGITDEVFFSAVLTKHKKVVVLSGAFNHCCMGDGYMPLMLKENILYGRNPFDPLWQKITFFHCDVSRRDPCENYENEIRNKVQSAWFL